MPAHPLLARLRVIGRGDLTLSAFVFFSALAGDAVCALALGVAVMLVVHMEMEG